jgi:hypothetical protein
VKTIEAQAIASAAANDAIKTLLFRIIAITTLKHSFEFGDRYLIMHEDKYHYISDAFLN